MGRQEEQGCRAGRKPYEQRLAAKDQARHKLRTDQMRGVGNWPTGKEEQR